MDAVSSPEMTQAEYARHRGVSRQAVNKWVDTGRIELNENGRIDVADADFELGEPQRAVAPSDGSGQLTKARTAVAAYDGRIKQLQYERLVNTLLVRSDVERSMELAGEGITREIDRLPAMADDIAAAFTRDGIKGLRRKLREVSDELRRAIAESMVLVKEEAEEEDEAA